MLARPHLRVGSPWTGSRARSTASECGPLRGGSRQRDSHLLALCSQGQAESRLDDDGVRKGRSCGRALTFGWVFGSASSDARPSSQMSPSVGCLASGWALLLDTRSFGATWQADSTRRGAERTATTGLCLQDEATHHRHGTLAHGAPWRHGVPGFETTSLGTDTRPLVVGAQKRPSHHSVVRRF